MSKAIGIKIHIMKNTQIIKKENLNIIKFLILTSNQKYLY